MILIIKHIAIEGPGVIGEFLLNTGFDLWAINLPKGAKLPVSLSGIEAVVSLGGPMNVYEDDKYPFLKAEDAFLKRMLKANIPFLGLCLGAQLLAKACGAKVKKSPQKEVGWYKINLTEKGRRDPLFKGFSKDFQVFQWHEDMFEIPRGGALLAESETCVNQAFRMGENAYGLQFHIEVTPDMVESWINEYTKGQSKSPENKKMITKAVGKNKILGHQARLLADNFINMIKG